MWLRAERLSETGVAFACAGSAPTETTIAFAGEKRLFLARISAAVVMVVSCWPVPVAAEVPLVASSPRGCALCAKKFALLGQVWA